MIIDKVKLMANDLVQMEFAKRQAIEGEDFNTAKSLKMQMDRV
jgi:hypothetical protein